MTGDLLTIPAAYLMGCFNTGYYLVRLRTGQDIRTLESGNTGSRNVGRLLGPWGFILTFIGDAGKGAAAVWFTLSLGADPLLALLALLAATVGHIWPVQLGFRGGKGFATFAGGMIILEPMVLLAGLVLCFLVYPFVRGTTKAGVIALAGSPAIMATIRIYQGEKIGLPGFFLYLLLVSVVLFAHRANIRKGFFARGDGTASGA
jgi:glycerol-3-phosphate acyltransferase PlsY